VDRDRTATAKGSKAIFECDSAAENICVSSEHIRFYVLERTADSEFWIEIVTSAEADIRRGVGLANLRGTTRGEGDFSSCDTGAAAEVETLVGLAAEIDFADDADTISSG
jgi:hypothetical protein